MMDNTIIVAGSVGQFRQCCKLNGLDPEKSFYINKARQIVKLKPGTAKVLFYGTWENHDGMEAAVHRLMERKY